MARRWQPNFVGIIEALEAIFDRQGGGGGSTLDSAGVQSAIEAATNLNNIEPQIGGLTEAAPATDTAPSGLNGRLQRIAQRITSLIGLLPGSLGQKTSANSLAVTIASDQSAIPVSGPLTDTQLRASALALPVGAATETTLSDIKTLMQGDRAIAAQQFIDSTGTIYLKVLAYNQQTNAYEPATLNFNGTAYTPAAPERPLASSDADTTETVWEITTAGGGYSVGDQVSQFTLIAQGPPVTVVGVIWYNQNTSAVITAPLAGHRRRLGAVAATENTLGLIQGQFGTDGTGIVQPTGGAGLRGWISGIYSVLSGALTNNTALFARLTDGTRNATIKAASTAAAAADTALVVAVSPNSGVALDATIGIDTDVTVPSTATSAATVKGLLRFIARLIRPTMTLFRNGSISNTPIQVKNTAGTIHGWRVINLNAVPVYVKLYDALPANVTLGVTAAVSVIEVPANGYNHLPAATESQDIFSTAISVAAVTGLADASAAPPASPIYVELRFI